MTPPESQASLGLTYGASFYDALADDVRSSAEVVAPIVFDLVRPASVLDVGCGHGVWLDEFLRAGVSTVLGIDGPHVSPTDVVIPPDRFSARDLSAPFDLDERFDLVVSLEVGEHLASALAPGFVGSLVTHTPVVLFSAAIPFQGGAGHVNEQWPSYWASLFAAHGYIAIDAVRPRIWTDERVAFWYAQNTIVYADPARIPPALQELDRGAAALPLDLVHPRLHIRTHTAVKRVEPPSLSRVLHQLPSATKRAVRTRAVPTNRRVKGLGGAKGRSFLQARKLVDPLGKWPVTITSADGLRLRITSDPVDEQIAHHLLGGHRADYFPAWPDGPPVGACILDIGAHHGLYAAAALHTYADSHIICVEPSAHALGPLRANLDANGFLARARIVRAGLAARAGEGVLRHTTEGTWGASLYEEAEVTTELETVPLASLDDILNGDRPDIIKSNAEGAEYALFDHLEASDLRPDFMLVMVHPEFGDMDRLLEQATTMGYRYSRTGPVDHPAFQMWRVPR